ncbi:hypothetical protein [Methylocapsa palsarum]|nr:hypothetical protein [Methylocapsa palsarum]
MPPVERQLRHRRDQKHGLAGPPCLSGGGVLGRRNLAPGFEPDQWGGYNSYTIAGNIDLTGKFETGPVKHSILFGVDYFNNVQPVAKYGFAGGNDINIYSLRGLAAWRGHIPRR